MSSTLLSQSVQITGSLLILGAFVMAQHRAWPHNGLRYLTLNTVGSAVLAVAAAHESAWAFLLLEGTWAVLSAVGLVRALRHTDSVGGQPRSARTHGVGHGSRA